MLLKLWILLPLLRLISGSSDNNYSSTTPAPIFNPSAIRWPLNATSVLLSDFKDLQNFTTTTKTTTSTTLVSERKLQRGKRYLDFQKGTRMSWRLTVKNTILKVNTLWAYGFGMRMNYPFPDKKDRLRPFFKRDVLNGIADLLDGHGFDGQACMLKSFCTALYDVSSQIGGGMLFKVLKVIFSLDAMEQRHLPYLRAENCHQILHSHCPLSFNSISPYTDDV